MSVLIAKLFCLGSHDLELAPVTSYTMDLSQWEPACLKMFQLQTLGGAEAKD